MTDNHAFKVLFAAAGQHFSERISDVIAGRIGFSQAQHQSAEEGFRLGELVHHSVRGWAVLNGIPSAGAPGWFTQFAANRQDALAEAAEWHSADPERREVIEWRLGSFAA